ncbi:MAG: oligosaccharide flippase family protein, partial [Planctomycetaceae bacterium]
MGSRRSIKFNLSASWLSHAVSIGIGIFLMPYVLHIVGDEAYGTWILIHAVAGYGGFLYLGFGQSICRYVADYYERELWDKLNEVVNIMFFIYLGMGALGFLIAAGIAWMAPNAKNWGGQSTQEIQLVVLVLGLQFFLGMVTSVFGGILVGIERFDLERGLQLIAGIARLILTVTFLSQRSSLLTLSLVYLAVTLIEHLGHLILAFVKVPTLSIGLRHFRLSTLREFASFSSYAWLNMISVQMIACTDTVIIGCILGAKATVPYHIAQRLCRFISTPILQIGEVLMPRAGALNSSSKNHELQRLVTQGLGASFLLTTAFFIGASFFGSMLITTWVGAGYSQSHMLLIVLLGTQIIATPISVVRSVLFGMGEIKRQSVLFIIEA